MKIALFGSTGKTGSVILKKLLLNGYQVKVLVRNPDKLDKEKQDFNQDYLEIIQGDVLNKESVNKTIMDCDLVISVLGHVKDTKDEMQLRAIKNIIESMNRYSIKRLITLTGAGVFIKEDSPSLFDKVMHILIKSISYSRFSDGLKMTNEIMNSNLDWTVIRAPVITNGATRSKYKIYNNLKTFSPATMISRGDLTDFIINNIKSEEYFKKLPVISY